MRERHQSGVARPLDPAKRQAILDGARAVFLRDGFTAGSMDDVAEAADVGKQTIYRHFGSKEALIVALVEAMCAKGTATERSASDGAGDLATALVEAGTALVEALTTPDSVALYRAVVGEAGRYPALGKLFWEAGPTEARASIASLLETRFDAATALRRADVFIQLALGQAYARLTLAIDSSFDAVRFQGQISEAASIALRRSEAET